MPAAGPGGRWHRLARAWGVPLAVLAAALGMGWGAGLALGRGERDVAAAEPQERPGEFDLVRLEYDSEGGVGEAYYTAYGRVWQRWETDFPEAEQNFAVRIGELTRIQVGQAGTSVRLTDDRIFDHPLVYLSDVGWIRLSEEERERLAEYLRRGGFAWIDDFWGDAEWDSFAREMSAALPDARWREVPLDHPVLHTVFDLDEVPQVPARDFADSELGREPPGLHRPPVGSMDRANLRGYFDADGRLLVLATHNTDLGDGFEREAYGQFFFEKYSTRAYALGVNIIVYAMTH